MKIIQDGATLCVSEVDELSTANSQLFQTTVLAALLHQVKQIDIVLSATAHVDCGGVGALVALRKGAQRGQGGAIIRLLNPPPQVQRLFHLTCTDQLFCINASPPLAPQPSQLVSSAEAGKPMSVL